MGNTEIDNGVVLPHQGQGSAFFTAPPVNQTAVTTDVYSETPPPELVLPNRPQPFNHRLAMAQNRPQLGALQPFQFPQGMLAPLPFNPVNTQIPQFNRDMTRRMFRR